MNENNNKTIIIGAGTAGLAAGWELTHCGQPVLLIEKEKKVGGLCQTFDFDGYKFDFGGHRFFSKQPEVRRFWEKILGEDFLTRDRLSRIYYRKKFFMYPIKLADALMKLGPAESLLIGASLVFTRIKKLWSRRKEVTFEDWVVNRFGRRLFNHFFKSYTEKVWGVSVKELGSDWAAQRMKDISLFQIVKSFFIKTRPGQIKSWIEKFQYPKYGPGMFCDRVAEQIKEKRGEIALGETVEKIIHKNQIIEKIIIKNEDGGIRELAIKNLISSMPLNLMLSLLSPAPPERILALTKKMRFRSFFDVCLIIDKKDIFPDNWIYIHEPEVSLVRVQNFKNWSPFMCPNGNKTNVGVEYICWDSDDLWKAKDSDLIDLAAKELQQIGLVEPGLVKKGFIIRSRYAYPVYHLNYKEDLAEIFAYLSGFRNFQTIGRAGLYRYNNMDHSILSGFYAARNVLGQGAHNVLEINADEDYSEIGKDSQKL